MGHKGVPKMIDDFVIIAKLLFFIVCLFSIGAKALFLKSILIFTGISKVAGKYRFLVVFRNIGGICLVAACCIEANSLLCIAI